MKDETKNNKPKKKRGLGFCGCFAIICLVFVLLVGAGVGVSWYFGDKYMKEYFDMSLTDAFGVVGGMYKTDESKIVTNAPQEGDEQKFYNSVSESLYLKKGTLDADSFSAISDMMTESDNDSTEETESSTKAQVKAIRNAAEEGDTETALENLICRDNMDIEKIRAKFVVGYDYAGNYEADFTAEVTDRELFSALKTLLDDKLAEQENAMLDYLSIEQLTLSKSADGNAVVTVVAKLDLKGLLESQLESAGGMVQWVVTSLLPDKVFVTASLETAETLGVNVVINQMDESGMDDVYKLIGGVLKLQGSENTDAKQYLSDTVNEAMGSIIETINDTLDLNNNVSDGKIRFDVYSILATTAFSDKDITKVELAEAYTSVVAADVDNMLENNEELLFENKWEVDNAGSIIEVYSTDTDAMTEQGATAIDYGDRFIEEFEKKYLMHTEFYRVGDKTYFDPVWTDESGVVYKQSELSLDGGKPTANNQTLYRLKTDPYTIKAEITEAETADYTVLTLAEYVDLEFSDLAALMGVGTSDKITGIKLEGLFDSGKLTEKLGGGTAESQSEQFLYRADDDLRFNLTDKMLARLMAEQTKNVFSSDNTLTASLSLKFVGLTKGNEETLTLTDDEGNTTGTRTIERRYMTVGFTASTDELLGSAGIIKSLVGDKIGVLVKLDVTPGLESKYVETPAIEYADLGKERTDDLLATLGKVGASSFQADELDRQLAQPVRDLIDQMSQTLGEVTIENGKLSVPNVFSLLASQLFPENAEKTYNSETITLSGADVHTALKGIYDLPSTETEGDNTYIARVTGSNNDYEVQKTKVDNLNNASFAAQVAKPDADLGRVLGYYEETGSDTMYVTYGYSLAQYLDGSSSDMSLLTVDEVIVTFVIDKSAVESAGGVSYYKAKMYVNNMNDSNRTLLEKMITYFDQDNEDKFTELETKVGAYAYTIVNTPMLKNFVDTGSLI